MGIIVSGNKMPFILFLLGLLLLFLFDNKLRKIILLSLLLLFVISSYLFSTNILFKNAYIGMYNNVKTTMKLGQARGAVLIAAAQSKIKIYEYSARKIKLSLTGNGNSHKDQVRYMVENKLNLNLKSQKTDASDALAAALCHEQQFRSFEI